MAVGRCEFTWCYLDAMERLTTKVGPEDGPQLGVGAGAGGPRRLTAAGRRAMFGSRWRRPGRWRCAAPSWSSDSGEEFGSPEETTQKSEFPEIKCLSQENLMERLPPELLLKVLSYLDISSLLCISQVNKLLHRLANDNVIWFRMYTSGFRRSMWRPKLKQEVQEEVQPVVQWSVGHWKKMYFRTAAVDMYKWRKELKVVSPYTGLPQQTEHILRSQNLSWQLRLRDVGGQESRHRQNRAVFSGTSLIICWSDCSFPTYQHISRLQLHAIHRGAPNTPGDTIPGWSSLLLDMDVGSAPSQLLGKGRLVVLTGLPHGVVVGTWRGNSNVAFIMISLHLHKLVERSFLGSPVCPYSDSPASPLADPSDLQFGLHGYTLHFLLHNTDACIMSGYFHQLSCCPAWIRGGLVGLTAISRTNVSQHRSLSGGVRMLWKNGELDGSVENCCFMTLTLLDQFQQPFWCESAPVCVTPDWGAQSPDYSGDHFLMTHCSAHGRVKMKLVWLKEQRQFFLVSLVVSVFVLKVNRHFGTEY